MKKKHKERNEKRTGKDYKYLLIKIQIKNNETKAFHASMVKVNDQA